MGDATPVRNLLSRGLGYDEGGVRNRETGGVGWLRWNTGRVSSKETTWRVEGGRKERRKCRRPREDEAVVGGLGYIRKVLRVVWVTVVGLRDEAPW